MNFNGTSRNEKVRKGRFYRHITVAWETLKNAMKHLIGGRGGIRTHGTLAGTPVFKTGALNHSATLPLQRHQALRRRKIKNAVNKSGPWPQLGPKARQDPRKLIANASIAFDSDVSAGLVRLRFA